MTWATSMLVFGLVGLALSAAMILPAAELFQESARGSEHFSLYTGSRGMVNLSSWQILENAAQRAEPGIMNSLYAVGSRLGTWLSLHIGWLAAACLAFLTPLGGHSKAAIDGHLKTGQRG